MTSEVLGVIQIGHTADYPLDSLVLEIPMRYPWFRVEKITRPASPEEAYDSRRNQYHSTRILALLEKLVEQMEVERLLGVTAFDLYIPGMNFLFGEARRPGRAGVISTHRLKPAPPSEFELFHSRVVKEAIHEIGHMLGLRHCSDDLCVMHFSVSISDTDRKHAELCPNCRSRVRMLEVE